MIYYDIMKLVKIFDKMNIIKRDLNLIITTPISYLYSFTYNNSDKIQIRPFDPKIKKLGLTLINQIKVLYPDITILFQGSAALELPGQADIDLVIPCLPINFSKYYPGLRGILGQPSKIKTDFIEWHTSINKVNIELLLINPKIPMYTEPYKIYKIFTTFPDTVIQYKHLKLRCHGISTREYKRRRLYFFNQLIKQFPQI